MEESKSPLKSVKTSRNEARGVKAPSTKSLKEVPAQKEGTRSASRSKENVTVAKDGHKEAGSHGLGKGPIDGPQDQGRGKPRRLTGRTSSGERGKGKAGGQQQAGQVPNSRALPAPDSGPTVVPKAPKEGPAKETKSSKAAHVKEKPIGVSLDS